MFYLFLQKTSARKKFKMYPSDYSQALDNESLNLSKLTLASYQVSLLIFCHMESN